MSGQAVFAQRLRMTRTQKKMTQKDLAEKIGMKAATVSAYESVDESKRITPSLENALAIARELGVSLDYLCGLDVSEQQTVQEKAKVFLQNLTLVFEVFPGGVKIQECTHVYWPIDDEPSEKRDGYGIIFSEKAMKDFLTEWQAIWKLREKETLDVETYNSIVKVLCDKYAQQITDIPWLF